jgi:tRNA pseudouridine55 synthase
MDTGTYDGLLVLDKPGGITSRAAVDRALRWFPRRTRVGHTGTLDPLATGVLVLCVGPATRLTEYVQRMGKTYTSVFRLGARSDTDDADGTVTEVPGAAAPDPARVRACLAGFVGPIEQVPPAYSAAKVTGRRAYDLARGGREVALGARRVEVYGIDVLRYEYPELEVEVRCGKGTYVRSLARDVGERLGCGAYVSALRRTRVGAFTAEGALSPEADAETARSALLPAGLALAGLPRVTLDERQAGQVRRGQGVPWAGPPAEAGEVAVLDASGRLVAVGSHDPARGVLRPVKVLG